MNIFVSPFKFLKISYPGRIHHVVTVPLMLSISVMLCIFVYPKGISVIGPNGIFGKLLSILPVLGGFFIAALTVIVSNDHPLLREAMNGSRKPYIPGEGEPLTRARFLSLLFGYLSFSSFLLMTVIFSVETLAPALRTDISELIWNIIKIASLEIIFFWLFHMFVATMIGLHYFSDRLYRSDGKAKFGKPLPPAE